MKRQFPIQNFCQGVATLSVPRSTFCFQFSTAQSLPLPRLHLSVSATSLISTHRTRWLTISMLQQWQQYDCLCLSPFSLFSLSLALSVSLSGSVQFMIWQPPHGQLATTAAHFNPSILATQKERKGERGRGSNLLGAMCHVCSVMLWLSALSTD